MNTRLTFVKTKRLLKLKEFRSVNGQGQRRFGSTISLTSKPNKIDKTRLGITVTKKFGKSHDRNRFKRLVREAFRLNYSKLPVGLDLVVRPSSKEKNTKGCQATLRSIEKELVTCCSNLSMVAK